MKKLLTFILSLVPAGGGIAGALAVSDPLISSLVATAGGAVSGTITLLTAGSEFLGIALSFFGRMKYGVDKWENEIEPQIEAGLTGFTTGLNKDDKPSE